jgi:hypothetical protein
MPKFCTEVKDTIGSNSPLMQLIIIISFVISVVIFTMILMIVLNNPITPMSIAFLVACSLILYILLIATIYIIYARCCLRKNNETIVVNSALPQNESIARSVNESVARSHSRRQNEPQEDIETGNVRGANPLHNPKN